MSRRIKTFLITTLAAVAPLLAPALAHASPTAFQNTASIALNDPNTQNNGDSNATAGTYPSTIAVSGLSGTVSNVTLTLNKVTYAYSDDIDVLLVGPGGQTFIPIAAVGPNGPGAAASSSTITLSDAGTKPSASTAWGSSATFAPANYGNTSNGFNEIWEAPAPVGPYGNPGPDPGPNGEPGVASFASQFDGINPNGTWSLYVITTSGGDGTGAIAGGWTLNITTAPAALTSTALTSSQNPSFTSGASSSVQLTATVSSGGNPVTAGNVNFTDGIVSIPGCGSVAVNDGIATCTTTFTTEGEHPLEATYVGTTSFGRSNGSLTQEVDAQTTVTSGSYCNNSGLTLTSTTAPQDASPYPSRVFVSGLAPNLTSVTATLKGVTYPESQDIDVLLVGPSGQSLILVGDAGPNTNGAISNVTLTLADSASVLLPQSSIWAPASTSVTVKPTNYVQPANFAQDDELWGLPAPSGPYGDPAPSGSATLTSAFGSTTPNGTWSLYAITTAAGDGTGAVGGWCIKPATTVATPTITGQSSSQALTTGQSFTDTATVTPPASGPNPTGSVTFSVYGPSNPTCTGSPAFTSTESLNPSPSDASTAVSSTFTPTTAGTYEVVSSYGGEPGLYNPAATSCGDASESVAVSAPVTTTVTTTTPITTPSTTTPTSTTTTTTTTPSSTTPVTPTNTVSNSFKIADVKVAGNGKVSFKVKVPGPGYVAVLETAPSSNIARTSKLSAPHGQFAFGRTSKHLGKAGTDALSVSPSAEGRKLLAHHRSTVKIKLWVEFTPTGGRAATHTVSGLRVPG